MSAVKGVKVSSSDQFARSSSMNVVNMATTVRLIKVNVRDVSSVDTRNVSHSA